MPLNRPNTPVFLQSHAQKENPYVSSISHRPRGTLARCMDMNDPAINFLGKNPRHVKDVRAPLVGSNTGKKKSGKSISMVPKESRTAEYEFRKTEEEEVRVRGDRYKRPPPFRLGSRTGSSGTPVAGLNRLQFGGNRSQPLWSAISAPDERSPAVLVRLHVKAQMPYIAPYAPSWQ